MQPLCGFQFVAVAAVIVASAASIASAQPCGGLEAHLHPHDPWPFKNFGRAVGVSGDTAIVGAVTDLEQGTEAGAAYIFRFDGSSWNQTQKLLASDGAMWQWFGRDVVIEDTTAIVGAVGKVYAFLDVDGTWIEDQMIVPAAGTVPFGGSLAMGGDVFVVASSIAGAAWVFRHDGTQWVEEQMLTPSDGGHHNFGEWQALGIHGEIIAVGAPTHPGLNPPKDATGTFTAGAVYIFQFDGEQWVEKQIISPFVVGHPSESTRFGNALDLEGDLLVIGNPISNNFAAFIYRYDPLSDEWVEEQEIIPPAGATSSGFGRSIAIEDETILIGDWLHSGGGAVFIYEHDDDGFWDVTNVLTPNPNPWTNFFGRHLAIDNGIAVIGANGEDQQSGAAYIYNLTPKTGDLNCDGVVNVHDLLILITEQWGECAVADDCPADFNGDGVVNVFDLLLLLANWG